MSAKDDQLLIDQFARVATSQGWEVLATDRSGNTLRVTVERQKASEPLAIGAGTPRNA